MCHVVGVSPFACMTYAAAKACKEVLKDPATTIVQQVQTLVVYIKYIYTERTLVVYIKYNTESRNQLVKISLS